MIFWRGDEGELFVLLGMLEIRDISRGLPVRPGIFGGTEPMLVPILCSRKIQSTHPHPPDCRSLIIHMYMLRSLRNIECGIRYFVQYILCKIFKF